MSFDALILPSAPQPPAGGAAGSQPAAFDLDRSTPAADQDKRFLATLNRVCERKSCNPAKTREGDSRSTISAEKPCKAPRPNDNRSATDLKSFQDRPVESETDASALDLPHVRRQPLMGLIHQALLNTAVSGDVAAAIEGPSDVNAAPIHAFVNRLIGHMHSDGHSQLAGLTGIGPFEQLQADISAQADNLNLLRQLAIQALNDQLAADPSGRQVDQPIFEFLRSLESAPIEGANPDGRADAFAARFDQLIDFLLQHYANRPTASGLEGALSEAGGQKAAATLEAHAAGENLLLQKMTESKQPAEIQAALAGKDGYGPAGSAKAVSAEALLEARSDKNGTDAPAARMQAEAKTAEPASNPNLAGQNVIARPAEETFSLKPTALQNDMLSADQTGNKVIQIDGESKDSGLLTSQESLPEHLSKLENGSRSTEGAQRSLASQTLNQIVQKAVLLNNNGQNTVQIDLKPEFLGHIRMHIMTESHQVAVRIVAELPVVKDLLENNLNQLKTELQAQGLQVDELEVSVAHDSRAEDDLYQKAAQMKRARASRNAHISAEGDAESQKTAPGGVRDGMAQTAVDYFA